MLCYRSKYSALVLQFVTYIFLFRHCHTVANAAENVSSHNVSLSVLLQNSTHLKRDDFVAKETDSVNQTILQIETDKPSSIVTNSIETQVHTKPSLTENDYKVNSTASLPGWIKSINNGALQRTGYVVLGCMLIIVGIFIIRAIRLRHKKSKSRKYGIITSTATDMEMEPLDRDDDDEEDATLFDAQHKYSLQ